MGGTKVTVLSSLLSLVLLACGGGPSGSPPPGDGGAGGTGGGGEGGTGGENPGGSGGEGKDHLPRIDRLEPDHGIAGTKVIIHGANFVPEAHKNRVMFGGGESAVFSAAPDGTRLETAVPGNARTGMVVVLTDGVRVEGPNFTVDPNPVPVLQSISPNRVRTRREATITLSGSDFLHGSKVLLDGVPVPTTFRSSSQLEARLSASSLEAPGVRAISVRNEPPGGGESGPLDLEVFETIDLMAARATSPTSVRLAFDEVVDPVQATHPTLFTFNGGLQALASFPDPEDGRRVHVETTPQTSMAEYRVTVLSSLRSTAGGELQNNQATFRGYRTLPHASGSGGGTGCDSRTLSGPSGITLGSQGNFIVERTGHQVQVVSRNQNRFTRFFGHDGTSSGSFEEGHEALGCPDDVGSDLPGAFSGPMGKLVLLAGGNRLVSDTGNDRLVVWSAQNQYLHEFGSDFVGPVLLGLFDGELWVAGADDRIQVLDLDGAPVDSFGGPGSALGEFAFGIDHHLAPAAVEYGGEILVTDPRNHRIQRFRPGGTVRDYVGGGSAGWTPPANPGEACCDPGSEPGYFTRPRGIAVWEDDVVVVDEAGAGRLLRLKPDGTVLAEMPLGFVPSGMAVSGSGTIWILDETNNLVRYYR